MPGPTIPTMATAVPGQFETAAFWNAQVRDLGLLLLTPPLFAGWYAGAAQSIPNNAWTHVLIDTETADTVGGHDLTTNSQRYTCQVPGVYLLSGSIAFVAGGTGIRGAKFMLNTNTSIPGSEQLVNPVTTAASTVACTESYVRMAAGDYVELFAFQNSGAALNTTSNGSGDYAVAFSCLWVGA